MMILVGLGWLAVSKMSIGLIVYYGVVCLVEGIFELIAFADIVARGDLPLFDTDLPLEYNLLSVLMVLIPVSILQGAAIAYFLYDDFCESMEGTFLPEPLLLA